MKIAEPLDRLITAVSEESKMGRNEVCFKMSGNKRGTVSVAPHFAQKKGLLSVFTRGKGPTRYIRIATGRTVDILDMDVDCQDVQSQVEYRITLRFDAQTPEKDNWNALQKMVEVFADTIPDLSLRGRDDPDSGPSRRFRDEMHQWLATRYRSGDRIKTSEEWRLAQALQIDAYIAQEYGLDIKVKLTIKTLSQKRLGPVEAKVDTNACDSKIAISLPLKVGCELMDGKKDLFEAVTFSESDLQALIERRVDRFIRDQVTLQQFRFENAWLDDMRESIEKDLQAKGRTITSFIVEHSPASADYEMGPINVKTEPVAFIPSGWDEGNTINFISNAQVHVNNAAIHEPLYEASDFNKMKPYLHDWFTKALNTAIHDCLHRIHDKNVGYATLLTDWDSTFQKNIRTMLEGMAKEAGLVADAIISNPERPEVKLPQGVWIHIPVENSERQMFSGSEGGIVAKKFASMTPSMNFELAIDAHVKIRNFADIKDILNQTTDALAYIREQLIEPAVRHVCQDTDTVRYYSAFEFVPAGETGISFTEMVERKVREALIAKNIQLLSLRLRRADEHIWEKYTRITGNPPQRVEFYIKPLVRGAGIQDVSSRVSVSFDLNITGMCEDGAGWGQFVPLIWPDEVEESRSYYQPVYDKVKDTISEKFHAGDIDSIKYAEFSAEDKKEFELLLNRYVNDILDKNFGLRGEAISIKRDLSDQEQIYIENFQHTIEHKRRLMQAEQAKDIHQLDADVKVNAVQQGARITDAREESDTRMPGYDFGQPGDTLKIEDFDSLDFKGREPGKGLPSHDGAKETPPPEPEAPSAPEGEVYEMPPEDKGKP